ncbi:MAG: hypothetical protein AAF617_16235 [Bacteroidota bacterium]
MLAQFEKYASQDALEVCGGLDPKKQAIERSSTSDDDIIIDIIDP